MLTEAAIVTYYTTNAFPKLPLTTCIIAVVERKRAPDRKRMCSLLKHHWQTARVEGEGVCTREHLGFVVLKGIHST